MLAKEGQNTLIGLSEIWGPLLFLLLDDEKVHGIVLNLPLGDRYYPIEAVLELDEEDPLLGVLFVPDQ